MLKIYDTNHNAIGHIVKYKDLKIEGDVTTGDRTLSFTYMARHHEICEEFYIETQDDEYVVKEKSVSTDGFLSFVAVLNLEDLEAKPWSSFGVTESTIADAAKLALAGSGWTVGECTVTKKRNAGILQTNALGVIQKLCTAFMCEVVYDTKKKTVSFYDQVGQDKGNFFLTGLNLKRLQRKGSTYDYYTRIIPIGQDGLTIESVNDGKNYLENYQYTNKVKAYIWKDESYTDAAALKEDAEAKLKDLSKPEVSYSADIIDLARQRAGYDDFSFSLGDTITLIDAATGIREKQRIIKLIQYPQNHTKDECELANKLPSFEETREKLQAAQEIINTVISDDGRYTGTINVSDILHFNEGVSGSSAVGALQGQYNTLAGSLSELKISVGQIEANYIRAEEADIKYATIDSLKALEIETASIKSKYAKFESTVTDELAANKALINELDVEKLNATDADLKYANIDFSNIGVAAMEKFYSESGLIKNVVVGNQTITGELVGVTIKGDLIEGNTLKADKLVIKGKDGLYYKLNTDGTGVTSEQTDENSLNGTVIQAKSITADKVAVSDLVAFGADIGGNHIGNSSIYSGAKTSALNTTRGFYLGSDGQVGIGDTNNYIQFFKDNDGAFHLRISAEDIVFGKSKQTIESAINNIDTKINNVKSIIDTIYTYQVGTSMTDTPTGEWLSVMPNVPQGQYLWTKETTLYSDGTTSVGYIATRMGVDGAGGAKGDTGPQGPKGEKGDKGDTGSRGPQGNQGVPGEKGEIGPQGPQGIQGNQGIPGENAHYIKVKGSNLDAANGSGATAVILNGVRINENVNRGHLLVVIDPITNTAEYARFFDTYNDATCMDGIADVVSAGKIFCLASYDATSLTRTVRNFLLTCGSKENDTWAGVRYTHVFIGMRGLARGNAYEWFGHGSTAIKELTAYYTSSGIVLNGMVGDTGATGPQGPQGNQGIQGIQGIQGPQGVKGDTGPQGNQGPQGVKGDKGATGDTGPQGPQGNQGVPGVKGDTGATGNGIASTVIEYQAGSSSTAVPNGTWSKTPVTTTAANPYFWTKTTVNYTNGAVSVSYNVGATPEGIEVGGRNLLPGSHKNPITYNYPGSDYTDYWSCVTTIPLNGDTYTLSFWAKSTVAGDVIRVHFYNPTNIIHVKGSQGQEGGWRDGQCDFVLSTTLTKYWVTYTIPKGGDSTRNIIIPRIGPSVGVNGSGIITIQWEKLEEGNKATDWTPAPEDVDAAVDAANNTANAANSTAGSALSTANSANSTANSASSKADAASGMAVDAKNVADSADASIANWCYNNDRTYINGGRLYAGTVTATQLAADSVTADKIGAAAVTSEKIAALSVTAAKIDVADLFAQNITATGTISGLTLTSADVVAKRIIATKEISLSCKNTADVERVLYYDGTSVRVGKLLNAAGAQSGAGFEFFDKTITMYGSLNLYSGDITIPGKVQGKTITATVDMNTNTIYASNWFRSRGTTGWYSEDYGGGWYMTDADWIRAYNGKGIATNGNMSIGGYIKSNNIINTTYEYQSNRGSVDWRFGAATGTGDENFFSFYDANNGIIPLAIDGNFGNIYVGFNVGGSGSKTAVGIYLGAQVAGNRAFIYHGDSYAGSIWIQTRLDGSWKWFSLGRVCSTALSDIRLKGNIRDTEVENATKVIESMKIRSFERKDSHKKYKIGFIADELEQLDPNLVDGGGEVDGHPYYKSVNNLQMLAYVVKSMQELNQRVSELEKENEKLKRKLNLN